MELDISFVVIAWDTCQSWQTSRKTTQKEFMRTHMDIITVQGSKARHEQREWPKRQIGEGMRSVGVATLKSANLLARGWKGCAYKRS
ncbi:hypothetical protein HK101_008453 [Irineochytrium annulatum]|nr:hypothetical protein HK101_008453 [Irineochytrium annulatum]